MDFGKPLSKPFDEVAAIHGVVVGEVAAPGDVRFFQQGEKSRGQRQQRADRVPFSGAFLAFFRGFSMAMGGVGPVLQELVGKPQ